eukprot:GDKJ01020198.1.p1 GENE.GDKJ01020198.1~~GDKJ01020198.1.p1  ORF type:complete len:635 (-),score=107.25 GDKJ01020198.1:75-1979(-)
MKSKFFPTILLLFGCFSASICDKITKLHGDIGLKPDGTPAWNPKPMPPPITETQMAEELVHGGGLYVAMTDATPLDRNVLEVRDPVCLNVKYNIETLKALKTTVIITFHEEWLSTLLRSVHSVLNRTPPDLLHEILLIDDASTKEWLKEPLDEYMKYLPPKVKLIRLVERHGVVRARLHGAKLSQGNAILVLDSHIEVSEQWIEPLLEVLHDNPKAIATPQIDSIISTDFSFTRDEGIGCYLSLKFTMIEEAHLSTPYTSREPVASPIMAGGLWAARRDWFFELGGYDAQMDIWGAEHLEFSMRVWMCGGRVLCAPCSRVYHVFRRGSELGYSIPLESIWRNRLRTAVSWMGPYAEIAEAYNHHPGLEIGDFQDMWKLQERLNCKKDFTWYLQNVMSENGSRDPNAIAGSDVQNMDDVQGLGEIISVGGSYQMQSHMCLDLRGSSENGARKVGLYNCYDEKIGGRGQQGFLMLKKRREIRLTHLLVTDHEKLCYLPPASVVDCRKAQRFSFQELTADERASWDEKGVLRNAFGSRFGGAHHYSFLRIRWVAFDRQTQQAQIKCLSAANRRDVQRQSATRAVPGLDLILTECQNEDINQIFAAEKFPNGKWMRPKSPFESAALSDEAGEEIKDEL